MRWWLSLGGGIFVSTTAWGQTQDVPQLPVDLSWQGPDSCSGADPTLAEIRGMLGNKVLADRASRAIVTVLAQQVGGGKWSVQVTTTSGDLGGERTLLAESCDDARRAVALLVALMIDPDAHVRTGKPADSQAPKSETPVAASVASPELAPPLSPAPMQPTRMASVVAPSASTQRHHGYVGLNLAIGNGTLPMLDAGAGLSVGIHTQRWSVAVRATAWWPRQEPYENLPGSGATFALYDSQLATCVTGFGDRRANFLICAGPQASLMHASSYGVSSPGSATKLTLGLFGETALRVTVRQGLAVRLAIEGLLPFQRPKYSIRDLGPVFQQNRFSERITLGTEFEIW